MIETVVLERIALVRENLSVSERASMVGGTVPRLFSLAEWRALAGSGQFDVQRLAALREVSLSVRSLERLFEKNFGATPSHYLTQWRAEAARDYIMATGASNKQAADKFGFWDEAHLCHFFKRLFKQSPQSFAKRAQSVSREYTESSPSYKHPVLGEGQERAKKQSGEPNRCVGQQRLSMSESKLPAAERAPAVNQFQA